MLFTASWHGARKRSSVLSIPFLPMCDPRPGKRADEALAVIGAELRCASNARTGPTLQSCSESGRRGSDDFRQQKRRRFPAIKAMTLARFWAICRAISNSCVGRWFCAHRRRWMWGLGAGRDCRLSYRLCRRSSSPEGSSQREHTASVEDSNRRAFP